MTSAVQPEYKPVNPLVSSVCFMSLSIGIFYVNVSISCIAAAQNTHLSTKLRPRLHELRRVRDEPTLLQPVSSPPSPHRAREHSRLHRARGRARNQRVNGLLLLRRHGCGGRGRGRGWRWWAEESERGTQVTPPNVTVWLIPVGRQPASTNARAAASSQPWPFPFPLDLAPTPGHLQAQADIVFALNCCRACRTSCCCARRRAMGPTSTRRRFAREGTIRCAYLCSRRCSCTATISGLRYAWGQRTRGSME